VSDFSTYRPPGVYIEEARTPVIPVIGAGTTSVAILGPSRGYRTFTEMVTLAGEGDPVLLNRLGIDPTTVTVTSPDGTTIYSEGTDFALIVGDGADGDPDTLIDNTLSVDWIEEGDIPSGGSVRVRYRYTDAEFYSARQFSDFDDVKDFYGEPFDVDTGDILSPLAMAAQVAFSNGAQNLFLVATPGTSSATRAQLNTAYTRLSGLFDVGIVVPLPVAITGTDESPGDVINVASDLANNLNASVANSNRRVGIIGVESTVTIDPSSIAAGVSDARVMLAWPNRMNFYNGFTNRVHEVAGYYLAAAYAGRMASLPVEESITKKSVRGFAGIPSDLVAEMTSVVKNGWSASGVAVSEITRQRTLTVRHATSTNPVSAVTREFSVTRAKDAMIRVIQDTLDSAQVIGAPIRQTTTIEVKGIVQSALENLGDIGTIVSYKDLKARLRPGDPQFIEVKFEYRPAWPLNYIVVSFSLDTTTGEFNFDAAAGEPVAL
jgi:hypothetical protein